jgi:hypothetical protein
MCSIEDCFDNAGHPVVLGRVQTELINCKRWKTRIELSSAIFEYQRSCYCACSPRSSMRCSTREGGTAPRSDSIPPVSYGFRPRRRAHDAVPEIQHMTTRGYEWVLEADIQACFDTRGV